MRIKKYNWLVPIKEYGTNFGVGFDWGFNKETNEYSIGIMLGFWALEFLWT